MNNKKKPIGKIIAAGFTIILGLILAIGYPYGGVRIAKLHRRVVRQHQTPTSQKPTVKKSDKQETVAKRKYVPLTAPPASEEAQDEGC